MKSKLVVRAAVLVVLVTILGITWQALGGFHTFSTSTLQDLLSANTIINPKEKQTSCA